MLQHHVRSFARSSRRFESHPCLAGACAQGVLVCFKRSAVRTDVRSLASWMKNCGTAEFGSVGFGLLSPFFFYCEHGLAVSVLTPPPLLLLLQQRHKSINLYLVDLSRKVSCVYLHSCICSIDASGYKKKTKKNKHTHTHVKRYRRQGKVEMSTLLSKHDYQIWSVTDFSTLIHAEPSVFWEVLNRALRLALFLFLKRKRLGIQTVELLSSCNADLCIQSLLLFFFFFLHRIWAQFISFACFIGSELECEQNLRLQPCS